MNDVDINDVQQVSRLLMRHPRIVTLNRMTMGVVLHRHVQHNLWSLALVMEITSDNRWRLSDGQVDAPERLADRYVLDFPSTSTQAFLASALVMYDNRYTISIDGCGTWRAIRDGQKELLQEALVHSWGLANVTRQET